MYDMYVPMIPEYEVKVPWEKAKTWVIEAFQPLGQEYCNVVESAFTERWIDVKETKGKRSGAYSSGCFDTKPYMLLNYNETLNSVFTLAHEMGHSMHSYLSNSHQKYRYADYSIFVAEVASTFNETLLSGYLLDLYKDDTAMKAYILNREVDNFRATLYRQTMFAEFEKVSHSILEQNQPLTLEAIKSEYRKLLEIYFGDTMVIDSELELECLRIPHFYSAFYVYKYATGISAAIALADMVVKGGEKERDSYLNFLKLGGSRFPLDELLEAGVDMRTPEPVKQAIAHFEKRVGQLREEISSL